MFNGKKLKELEGRIAALEDGLGSRYDFLPGEKPYEILYCDRPRISIRHAVMRLCVHLGLEFKRTPETLEVVKTAKK